jgi:hypothetical protein
MLADSRSNSLNEIKLLSLDQKLQIAKAEKYYLAKNHHKFENIMAKNRLTCL